jgi:hypothetical protein
MSTARLCLFWRPYSVVGMHLVLHPSCRSQRVQPLSRPNWTMLRATLTVIVFSFLSRTGTHRQHTTQRGTCSTARFRACNRTRNQCKTQTNCRFPIYPKPRTRTKSDSFVSIPPLFFSEEGLNRTYHNVCTLRWESLCILILFISPGACLIHYVRTTQLYTCLVNAL